MAFAERDEALRRSLCPSVPRVLLPELGGEDEVAQALRQAKKLSLRVLVVDDDGEFSRLLQARGEATGWQVSLVSSRQAFSLADCVKDFDIAFVAYCLASGEQEGIYLAAKLKELQHNFPVVLMSAVSKTRLPRSLQQNSACLSVSKREGLGHILNSALRCLDERAA